MPYVRLKFKDTIPMTLEWKLMKLGYQFFARKRNDYVIYERAPIKKDGQSIDFSDLSELVVADLTRRVNRIAGSFENPDDHKELIKARCTNMANTLPSKEREWILDWIKRVIDEDDGDNEGKD